MTYSINQVIKYVNGTESVYTGTIVRVNDNHLTVIDCEAGMQLWNAGYSVGSYIHVSQVVNN